MEKQAKYTKLKAMKKAFSLLELVLVVLILGIISGIANLNFSKDKLMEGAKQILNDIRYTRTLAMMQEDFRIGNLALAKREWYKSKWQLYFIKSSSATQNQQTYTIFLDKNGDGNANLGKDRINSDKEIAVELMNPKKLMNSGQSGVISKDDKRTSKRFNIEKSFGITRVEFKGSCSGSTRVIFDQFGRLYSPLKTAKRAFDKNLASRDEKCILRLSNKSGDNLCIVIENLSGFAYIPEFQGINQQNIEFKNSRIKECSKI